MSDDNAPPGRKWVFTVGGFLAALRLVFWPILEAMDVIDGASSLLSVIKPFLVAHWLDGLSLFGVGLVVYELGRGRGWWLRLRGRENRHETRAQDEPATPHPPPPREPPPEPTAPKASPDSCEKLRHLYRHWSEFWAAAVNFFRHDVCAYHADMPEAARALAEALATYARKDVVAVLTETEKEFGQFKPQNATQAEFDKLCSALLYAVGYCHNHLIYWINRGGEVIHGDALFSSDKYVALYQRYEAALDASRQQKHHSELERLAETLASANPQLRKPTVNPASSAP